LPVYKTIHTIQYVSKIRNQNFLRTLLGYQVSQHDVYTIIKSKQQDSLVTMFILFFRYLKVSLVPSVSPMNWSFTTQAVNADVETPTFGDSFPVAVPKAKLSTKTLQVTIWTIDSANHQDCVGSAQISLADFDWETVSIR
jgi:hypothetical protein